VPKAAGVGAEAREVCRSGAGGILMALTKEVQAQCTHKRDAESSNHDRGARLGSTLRDHYYSLYWGPSKTRFYGYRYPYFFRNEKKT
jgi:hypothetical protein